MTALTIYYTKVADSLLTNAGDMATAIGGTLGNQATTIGGATGYGELGSLSAITWASGSGLGAPSAKGFVLPKSVLNLEGQQFLAGNWTPTVRLQLGGTGVTGTLAGDIYVRVYRRGAGGLYTEIGSDMVLMTQTITTTVTSFAFSATSQPLMNINLGDVIYTDVWFNCKTNAAVGGTASIKLYSCTTTGTGVTTAQIVTPGYQAQAVPSAFFIAGNSSRRNRSFGRIQ